MWLRALLPCDDVRLEIGGTMTLVGVHADAIIVAPGNGEIELPRLAVFCVVAGLKDATAITWCHRLIFEGEEPGTPIGEGTEFHNATADEHRLVHILSPVTLPGPGRHRLAAECQTSNERTQVEYRFTVERAPQTPE